MNASLAEPTRWSRQRWLTGFVLLLAAHVGLVFWLGERQSPAPPPPPPPTKIFLVPDSAVAKAIVNSPGYLDPTLFALPNGRGFSGGAWLRFSNSPPAASNWSEPPGWLALDPRELGGTFAQLIAQTRPLGAPMSDVARLALVPAEISAVSAPLLTQSSVRVEGPLAARPLSAPFSLPSPTHPDLLPDTIVQVKVNADGQTESVILLEGSGLKPLDQQALQLARGARFRPLPPGRETATRVNAPLVWGNLIFQWHTVAPVLTNGVAARRE